MIKTRLISFVAGTLKGARLEANNWIEGSEKAKEFKIISVEHRLYESGDSWANATILITYQYAE